MVDTVDWQQFYQPAKLGFGDSRGYVDQVNQERQREAMLKAEQLNQAAAQTSYMQTSADQLYGQSMGYVRNEYGGWEPAPRVARQPYLTTGGMPSSSGGGVAMPGYGGGAPVGGSVGAGTSLQSQSEQLRYDPWAEHRGEAGDQLAGEMGQASPSDFYQQKLQAMSSGQFSPDDPSYQFRFGQGQQAVERSAAARGLLNSGNVALELQQYGQGAASQEYGAQFNRMLQGLSGVEGAYNTQMNRLMEMAGVNINPVAGGQLNVAQGQLGVSQGELGLKGQGLANEWALQNRELDIKQQLANQAQSGSIGGMTGSDWSAIFNVGNR